jgi:hypothetical protein
MNATIRLLREGIQTFISIDPLTTNMYRQAWEDDGAGGLIPDGDPVKMDPVTIRITEVSPNENKKIVEGGEIPVHYVIVTATHDTDIQEDDVFEGHDGKFFKVLSIQPKRLVLTPGDTDAVFKLSGRAEEIDEVIEDPLEEEE